MTNPFAEEVVAVATAASELDEERVRELLTVPPKEEMGEYALPCFTLAKQLRKNPVTIAAELAEAIEPGELFQAVEAAGAYVNFKLDRGRFVSYVLGEVRRIGARYGSRNQGAGKTLVIDFSSPNLAKPFSIAHLRSTAIGNAIYRIHEFLGWRCVGINYLGDYGANFGQLLAAYQMWADPEQVSKDPVPELLDLYTRFNAELEEKPELQDQARSRLKALAAGDEEMVSLWQYFVDEGRKEAERVYTILDVHFDDSTGESHYADKLDEVVEAFSKTGLAVESDGALIVDLEQWEMAPCMLRTRNQTSTYHSRDIAALLDRQETFDFDKMVYVTDVRQTLHFRQVFKALELLGKVWIDRCHHAPFGMLSFKGAKLSTREGNMVFLEDVLDQAVQLTREIIAEKNPDLVDGETIARQVGISAVIFADLDSRRTRDVVFEWEEVLNFDGETGPYLQYTHARFCSILRRFARNGEPAATEAAADAVAGAVADAVADAVAGADLSLLIEDAEMRVVRQLEQFPTRLQQAADENEPSYVSTYLLELATVANKFYNELPVLSGPGGDLVAARLTLVDGVRTVLRTGLQLLGMKAPEEM